jgi:hypothetical protein
MLKRKAPSDTTITFFKHGSLANSNRIIFAALYPPSGSHPDRQYENRTSELVIDALGHSRFDWIDLYPYAPDQNKDFVMTDMAKLFRDNSSYRQNWMNAIINRIHDIRSAGYNPLIYVCGQICMEQWALLHPLSNPIRQHNIFDVYNGTISSVAVTCLYGPHPSYQLHNYSACADFANHMHILNALLLGLDQFDQYVTTVEKARYDIGLTFCQKLEACTSWPTRLNHFKSLPWQNIEFCQRLQICVDIGQSQLLYLPFFAKRFMDARFLDMLKCILAFNDARMTDLLNVKTFVKRICDPMFWQRFIGLFLRFEWNVIPLFRVPAFNQRIIDTSFFQAFSSIIKQHGTAVALGLFL